MKTLPSKSVLGHSKSPFIPLSHKKAVSTFNQKELFEMPFMKNKKNITIILFLLACLVIFSHCSMGTAKEAGSAAFGFTDLLSRAANVPSPAAISAVILTVTDADTGDVILDNQKITLYRFNSAYISDSINFMQGDYKLTEFLVVDNTDNTLYATPLEGSAKAGMVNDPLPMNFSVSPDTTTNVQTEVTPILSTDTPQDYGYSEFSFSIVLDPKSWSTTSQIDGDTGFASEPETVLDDYGRSITAWKEKNGSITNLWASRYTPQAGWGTPVLLDELNTADVGTHRITTDRDGNAIAVWSQHNGVSWHLWAKRYVQGNGWQPVEDIATLPAVPAYLLASTDGKGNTVVAWISSGKLSTKRYEKTAGWDAVVTTIFSSSYGYAAHLALDSNDNGKAVILWTAASTVYFSLYDPAGGWSAYDDMFAQTPYYAYHDLSASLDNLVNITIAYVVSESSTNSYVYGRRYTPQAGVSPAYSLDYGSYDSGNRASVSCDNRGNAMVTWLDKNDNIMAIYYDLEFGWQEITELFAGGTYTTPPRIKMDEYSNTIVMWTGTRDVISDRGIFYNYYDHINGWSATTLLEETSQDGPAFAIDMNFAGEASAAWEKEGTDQHIQAGFYR